MVAVINAALPNVIQVLFGSIPGPFRSSTADVLDPQRDFQVFINGTPIEIASFVFDTDVTGQYRCRLFTPDNFSITDIVQVIYHMPLHPLFSVPGEMVLPGFALLASVGDIEIIDVEPTPTLGLAGETIGGGIAYSTLSVLALPQSEPYPTIEVSGTSGGSGSGFGSGGFGDGGFGIGGAGTDTADILWYAQSVSSIRIQCAAVSFDTGIISAAGIYGAIVIPGLVIGTDYTLTLTAYDSTGSPYVVGGNTFVLTATVQVIS